jgi:hypothetical protein
LGSAAFTLMICHGMTVKRMGMLGGSERSALVATNKMKTAVAAGNRNSARGGGQKASSQLVGKRKANELLSLGDSMEPANRHPAPDTGSARQPALLPVRANRLPSVADNPVCPRVGRRIRPYSLETSPSSRQMGRSNPQSWTQTRPNPLFQPR